MRTIIYAPEAVGDLADIVAYLKPGLRSTVVEKVYLIIYRYDANSLEVARILHGARDIKAVFAEE